jgi:hypothetical protein
MSVSPEETYVLMPGLLYDGNCRIRTFPGRAIPQLATAENYQVQTPILTLSIPLTAFFEKRTGKTLFLVTTPTFGRHMTGCQPLR